MIIRVEFTVSVGQYVRGGLYDVEPTDEIRHLVEAGFAVIVPFPPVVP